MVSNPEFSPDALAQKLNETLDLGLKPTGGTATRVDMDLNIENVFAVIQSRLSGNPVGLVAGAGITQPGINSHRLHDAVEAIVQDHVDRIKVLQ